MLILFSCTWNPTINTRHIDHCIAAAYACCGSWTTKVNTCISANIQTVSQKRWRRMEILIHVLLEILSPLQRWKNFENRSRFDKVMVKIRQHILFWDMLYKHFRDLYQILSTVFVIDISMLLFQSYGRIFPLFGHGVSVSVSGNVNRNNTGTRPQNNSNISNIHFTGSTQLVTLRQQTTLIHYTGPQKNC